MAQRTSDIIFKDLVDLYELHNAKLVLAICAIALSKLMGRENWKSYLQQTFNDPEFKKLIVVDEQFQSPLK